MLTTTLRDLLSVSTCLLLKIQIGCLLYAYLIVRRTGFEPVPPKRIDLESIALDHSATDALSEYYATFTGGAPDILIVNIAACILKYGSSRVRTCDLPINSRML